jgi:hypothetical protein
VFMNPRFASANIIRNAYMDRSFSLTHFGLFS